MDYADRRRSPRYLLFASAEITDSSPEFSVRSHTSELARHGCYMDMMNPFLDGTPLTVRITHGGQLVEAAARVVHSQPNVGMGIAFDRVDVAQERILEEWMSGLQDTGV